MNIQRKINLPLYKYKVAIEKKYSELERVELRKAHTGLDQKVRKYFKKYYIKENPIEKETEMLIDSFKRTQLSIIRRNIIEKCFSRVKVSEDEVSSEDKTLIYKRYYDYVVNVMPSYDDPRMYWYSLLIRRKFISIEDNIRLGLDVKHI